MVCGKAESVRKLLILCENFLLMVMLGAKSLKLQLWLHNIYIIYTCDNCKKNMEKNAMDTNCNKNVKCICKLAKKEIFFT